jgi:hypothetical protein
MPGSQDFAADPRNATALINLNGRLIRRDSATVSMERSASTGTHTSPGTLQVDVEAALEKVLFTNRLRLESR